MTDPRRRALLAAPLLLAACSVLPDRPYVETRRFALAPTRLAPQRPGAGRRVLLIRLTRAAPGLDSRGLRTLRPDGTETSDFWNEWLAPPPELVEEALRRWLSASGLFSAVVAPGSRARADLIMETELTALHADPARRLARAGLSVVLLTDPSGAEPGRVLAQLTQGGTAPLPAPGADGEVSPEEAALAMNRALAEALVALEQELVRFA